MKLPIAKMQAFSFKKLSFWAMDSSYNSTQQICCHNNIMQKYQQHLANNAYNLIKNNLLTVNVWLAYIVQGLP